MRKPPVLLALGLVLMMALPPAVQARAVSVVSADAFTGNVDDNSIVVSTGAGNVLVVLGHILHASQTLTISDDDGLTWNACPAVRAHSTSSLQVGIWWAITAGAASTEITLTSGGGSANTGGFVAQLNGMGTPTCDEVGEDDDTLQTHGAAISVTPSTTRETFMVGSVASSSSATYSTPDGYTAFSGAPTVNAWAGYKLVASTDANTFQFGSGSNESTLTTLIALMSEDFGGGGGAVTCLRMMMGMGRC